jgi:antitoxin (DNA-binding transcriptional repressor) of toxin-antitoxin stability system
MRKLSIREARESLPSIGELLAKEGEILLTRRGRPIARILALSGPRRLPSRANLRSKMPRRLVPSEILVRADRNER